MTWAKYGTEFFDQLVDASFPADLDDACQLTHTQALHYLYSVEAMDMTFPKAALRRFATSSKADAAAKLLVSLGKWEDRGQRYRVLHHEDVFRQSLGYQLKERERSKKAMQKKRQGQSDPDGPKGGVTPDVPQDVTRNVMRTQSVSQSDIQPGQSSSSDEALNFDPSTGEVLDASSGSEENFGAHLTGGGVTPHVTRDVTGDIGTGQDRTGQDKGSTQEDIKNFNPETGEVLDDLSEADAEFDEHLDTEGGVSDEEEAPDLDREQWFAQFRAVS